MSINWRSKLKNSKGLWKGLPLSLFWGKHSIVLPLERGKSKKDSKLKRTRGNILTEEV